MNFNAETFISWVESFNWTPEEIKGWETFKLMLRNYTEKRSNKEMGNEDIETPCKAEGSEGK